MTRSLVIALILLSLLYGGSFAVELSSGRRFRAVDAQTVIKIVSADELELTKTVTARVGDLEISRQGPNLVCKYSCDEDTLRVVATLEGSPQALYYKIIPEGLQDADGLVLYDDVHYEAAAHAANEAAAAERERQLAAARAATPRPTPVTAGPMSGSSAKAVAISAPRPEYTYEMRTRHITGSGVVLMTVDVPSGSVTNALMLQSTGSSVLDNAAISAFRRWRFKPGTVAKVRMPITFTMTGAQF